MSGTTMQAGAPYFTQASSEKVGLWVLLAVISSLFFLFILAYLIRSTVGDWDALAHPWNPLSNRSPLWLNTSMLLCGSVALEWARRGCKRENEGQLLQGLMLGGLFTMSFIAGQLWIWIQLAGQGFVLTTNPATSFFYIFTALHGAHLIIGMFFWSRAMYRAWVGTHSITVLSKTVDLCTTYWHYLFGLWLVLFGLVAGPPETIALIASYCGII